MLGRLFREPLVHFAGLAIVIFAIYYVLTPHATGSGDNVIVVSAPKIQQMAAIFAKTWGRPPSADELKGQIDDYVKEEIYVREALALGLDRDDTVIRRRLQQKMEFLTDLGVDKLSPTDADLDAYLKAHPAAFEIDPLIGFEQIFFNPKKHGDRIEADAAAALKSLVADSATDSGTLGDATLLPADLPPTSVSSIGEIFGSDFADAVGRIEPGGWSGPIASSYGLHLVRVSERKPGRLPSLSEVRSAVLRDWSNERRKELADAEINALLKRYKVRIESGQPGKATP